MRASELINAFWDDYLDERNTPDAQRLFSDASILRRLNLAHREAVNRGLLIRDNSTSYICRIPLVADQPEYALDQRIIKVNAIRLLWTDGHVTDLPALSEGEMNRAFGMGWRDLSGQPVAYLPFGHTIRLVPTPSVDYTGFTLVLDVYRYPLATLVSGFVSTAAANASAGATSLTLHAGDGAPLPRLGSYQELHLASTAGTVIVTGIAGDVLTTLPLPGAIASGSAITADNEPEIPSAMHEELLYYLASQSYLKRDSDMDKSSANMPYYDALFTRAFGPPVNHAARMHTLKSVNSIRNMGLYTPTFKRSSYRSGWVVP